VIDAARAHGCGIIIVDSYDIDADYVAALRRTGALIVAFDDLAAVRTSAHVVVNGAAGAETLAYEPATPDTRILAGASYALLHKAFWNVPARHVARIATRVLVAVGGADPCRALPRIVHALDVVSERIETTAVIGPFFPRDRSELLPERYVHRVRFVDTPDDLLQLMLDADIAVSAGGQTLYELAATGTPAVAVEVASNQGFQIRGLAAAGVVFDAGQLSDRDFDARLSTAVERLLSDVAAREKMSVCGRRLVDGRGAARVAAAIASLL
jgi:spore coat polysaccharide biosynthesis predicted glycosyltransferase SpsG